MNEHMRVQGGAPPLVPAKIPLDAAAPVAPQAQSAQASAQDSAQRTASGRRKEGMLREAFAATRSVLRSPAAKELGATLLSEMEKALGSVAGHSEGGEGAAGHLAGLASLTGDGAARNPQLIVGAFKFLLGAAKSMLAEGGGGGRVEQGAASAAGPQVETAAPASQQSQPAAGHSSAPQSISTDSLLARMRDMSSELEHLSKDTSITGTVQAKAKMAELGKLADLIMTLIQMDVATSKKGNGIIGHAI